MATLLQVTGFNYAFAGLTVGALFKSWGPIQGLVHAIFTYFFLYWFNLISWIGLPTPFNAAWYLSLTLTFGVAGWALMEFALNSPPILMWETHPNIRITCVIYFALNIGIFFLYIHYYLTEGFWLPIVLALAGQIVVDFGLWFIIPKIVDGWIQLQGDKFMEYKDGHDYSPVIFWNTQDAKNVMMYFGLARSVVILGQFSRYITGLDAAGFGDIWVNYITLLVLAVGIILLTLWIKPNGGYKKKKLATPQ